MLRNQASLRDSLEVISDWQLLMFCSIPLLRNTVLKFQKNLFANMFRRSLIQAFGLDKENYECNDIQTKWTFYYIIGG